MVFCFASNINCIWRELCTRESFNTSNELIERPQSKPSQRKLNTTNNLRLLLCTIHNWEWQPEVSQQFALTLFFLSLSMKLLKLFKLRNIILFLFLCVHLLGSCDIQASEWHTWRELLRHGISTVSLHNTVRFNTRLLCQMQHLYMLSHVLIFNNFVYRWGPYVCMCACNNDHLLVVYDPDGEIALLDFRFVFGFSTENILPIESSVVLIANLYTNIPNKGYTSSIIWTNFIVISNI